MIIKECYYSWGGSLTAKDSRGYMFIWMIVILRYEPLKIQDFEVLIIT